MRKKTIEEKKLAGTFRPEREQPKQRKKIENNPTTAPPPETYLNGPQRKLYYRICAHVLEHSLMQTVDGFFISAVALSFWLIAKNSKIVTKEGATAETKPGAANVTGAYSVLKAERLFMDKAVKQLGLSVKAREDLSSFSEKIILKTTEPEKTEPTSVFGKRLKVI